MSEFPETNYSLIDRVKDIDDGEAWCEFLGIYQPIVYRMARRRGMQDADAMDVQQQVFASIARSIDGWEAGADRPPFRAWLTTIARNAITTTLTRMPKDRATGSTSIAELLHSQPDVEQTSSEVVKEMRQELVRRAAEQIRSEFTPATWEIFWKTAMEDVTPAEMAQRTGRSPGAIYVVRHRVLARLKSKVTEVMSRWELKEEG